jgi:hypothetical protein
MASEKGNKPHPSIGLITVGLYLCFLLASFAISLIASRFGGMEQWLEQQEGISDAYDTASGHASEEEGVRHRTVSSQ